MAVTSWSGRGVLGVDWCLWVACVLVVIGAAGPLAAAAGGTDRIATVAAPFAVAAVALAANAVSWRRTGGVAALLYAAAAGGIAYGLLRVLSVPLRLQVEGRCLPTSATCPVGFDYPMTSGENTGLYIAVIAGVLALVFSFIAAEMQYRRRPSRPASLGSPAPAPNLEPPPQSPASPPEPAADRDQN